MIAHDEMMEYMKNNFDKQDEAFVGIFWYDKNAKELFGIVKEDPEYVKPNQYGDKTGKTLHRDFWQRQYHRAKAKGIKTQFNGDYTQIPRGRVWQTGNKKTVVTVGEWINDFPEAKELVIFEFNLPDDTEFRIDPHWNIGSGWSGEKL